MTTAPVTDSVTATPPWHALEPERVLGEFESREDGLSDAEARARLSRYGSNVLPRNSGPSVLELLWRQLNNPLIYVLLGATALSLALGKTIDALVVLGAVVVNTVIGFLQEYRAGRAIEALVGMVPETATVRREGDVKQIDAADLVPGDVVTLQSGDKVPADMRLLRVRNLKIEEAPLTGESVPVEKAVGAVEAESSLGDRLSMAYGGTLVTYGTATAVVVGTGAKTELGRISSLLQSATELQTPLTKQLARVGKGLTVAILIVAALLVGVGMVRGYAFGDAALAAVTLAVGAIPEGLPAIVTIALAIGVQRMARRRAVIRNLPAVETLGSTTVICSDKTGTLTKNEMTVQTLLAPDAQNSTQYNLSGVGYAPEGSLTDANGEAAELTGEVRELLVAGALCNDSRLEYQNDLWSVTGDPTEGALLVAARKLGLGDAELRTQYPRLDAIPFESERQFMATLHDATPNGANPNSTTPNGATPNGGNERVIYLKGASEVIFGRCDSLPDRARLEAEVERIAAGGMRVLAFAARRVDSTKTDLLEADVAGGFTFLGLQGMIDPPRPEALEAVRACHEAGIMVKMITGDHKATAQAIGRELGLGGEAVSGTELERLSDDELRGVAEKYHVFARVAPEHKLRLVRALQANGHVVAMTGDGVNDAPALKQADIGVAMGITGTSVSKESADMVLVDDNFASIEAAVEEGRRVYDNLIKALAFVLPANLGLAAIFLAAVGFFPIYGGVALLPMQPTQVLWINLVASAALGLALAFEALEPGAMRRPPRNKDAPLLSRFVVVRTAIVALLMAAGSIGLFLVQYYGDLRAGIPADVALREAQTMAVTTVILFQMFYLLNCRSLSDSAFKLGLWSNPWVYVGIGALFVLQLGFIYLPFMNAVFGSAPLGFEAWLYSLLTAAVVLPVVNLEKAWRKRRLRRRTARLEASTGAAEG